jgi:uncharacterized protein YhaN
MLIKDCEIRAFGRIEDLVLKGLDQSFVIIYGPNEVGKSTFFEFLKTMLYGIYPTAVEKHPHAPWTGRRLEGTLRYALSDGTERVVSRRLAGNAEGYLEDGDRSAIRNQTVPSANHVSRELFGSVFALDLAELAAIREKPWEEIQERLLGQLNIESLRPVSSVLKRLSNDAASLWRSDNLGKPKAKRLAALIRDLKKSLKQAETRDEEARELAVEISRIDSELQALEEEQVQFRQELLGYEKLVPMRKLLRKIEQHRKIAGDPRVFEQLSESSPGRLKELRLKLEKLSDEKSEKTRRLAERHEIIASFDESDRGIVDQSGEIQGWIREISSLHQTRVHRAEQAGKIDRVNAELKSTAREVLASEPTDEIEIRINDLHLAELRARIDEFQLARSEYETRRRDASTGASRGAESILIPAVGLFGAAVVLVLLGAMRPEPEFLFLGIGLAALAATWVIFSRFKEKRRIRSLKKLVRESELQLQEKSRAVEALLAGIPVIADRLSRADHFLVNDLQQLKRFLFERESLKAAEEGLSRVIREKEEGFRTWSESLPVEQDGSVQELVTRLESRLQEALKKKVSAQEAAAVAEELHRSVERIDLQLQESKTQLDVLEQGLRNIGEGDLDNGLKELGRRYESHQMADHLQSLLEMDFPDWKELENEILDREPDSGNELASDERLVFLKTKLERNADEVRRLIAEKSEKESDLRHLEADRPPSDIASEIANHQERLVDIKYERDRLTLLSQIIRIADQDFRSRHQPDVLRRASEYLKLISQGRYERLDFEEESQSFEIHMASSHFPIQLGKPLSRGTLDQVYLGLRLALVEHLDQGHEPLPVFLDEVLVNWDAARRLNGYEVLKQVAQNRQVFLFTCHRKLANETASALGAHLVDLPGSPGH